jgi:isopentenyl-diphosphate delta-isomerase type 1
MAQTLILVDEFDRVLGYASREECHRWPGRLHRAIALLIANAGGELLMQRRRSGLWDGWWDITGATHPLHRAEGDESYAEAAARCLRDEWGVEAALEPDVAFVYAEQHGDGGERELCVLFRGQHDGQLSLAPGHGYGYRWCSPEAARSLEPLTPWARIVLDRVYNPGTPR